jgi:hypothetical protein
MELFISNVGIRDYEYITSSSKASQNKGSVLEIKGFYPPNIDRVNELDETFIRDQINQIDFFSSLSQLSKKEWLINNSTTLPDLYLEDIPNLKIKFIKLSGKFFTEVFSVDLIEKLIIGDPNDSEGFWDIN